MKRRYLVSLSVVLFAGSGALAQEWYPVPMPGQTKAVSLPAGTVPSANLPSANLPSANLPSANLPSATVPSVNLPSALLPLATGLPATLPSATLPSATVPSATLPSATLPSGTVRFATVPSGTVATSQWNPVPLAAQTTTAPQLPPAPQAKSGTPTADSPVLPRGAFTAPAGGAANADSFWGGVEYLLWWTKTGGSPPLAITGAVQQPIASQSATQHLATAPGFIGIVSYGGQANPLTPVTAARTVYGDGLNPGAQSGTRLTFGGWIDSDRSVGVEASYSVLISRADQFHGGSNGTPALAIPYINANFDQQTSFPVANGTTTLVNTLMVNTTPGVFVKLQTSVVSDTYAGTLNASDRLSLQEAELNTVWNPVRASNWNLQVLTGLRYIQFDDNLAMDSRVEHYQNAIINNEPALGLPAPLALIQNTLSLADRVDQFSMYNSFYGGQLGLRGTYSFGRFTIEAGASAALGDMHEIAIVNGTTNFIVAASTLPDQRILLAGIPLLIGNFAPGVTNYNIGTTANGLFAQPTNIGHHSRDVFAVAPEGKLRVTYRITDRISASVGYSFLYLSDVLRAGDQIDTRINPAWLTLPNGVGNVPYRPTFTFQGSDFWAQGVDLGLLFRF